MTNARKRRLYFVMLLLLASALVVSLILFALRQNINLFYTPQQLFAAPQLPATLIRVGGMVKIGSIQYLNTNKELSVRFVITDYVRELTVHYSGVLPDLFREGQGVVALGTMGSANIFLAKQILAKHDENYMPPQLRDIEVRQ